MGRPYQITPEARKQRSEAAKAKWAALSTEERTEALKPAYSVTPGNPFGRPKKKRRHAVRDKSGRFARLNSTPQESK